MREEVLVSFARTGPCWHGVRLLVRSWGEPWCEDWQAATVVSDSTRPKDHRSIRMDRPYSRIREGIVSEAVVDRCVEVRPYPPQ